MSDVAGARSRIAAFGWDYLWILMVAYLVGLTRFGGHRPLYDRLAGTVVVRS